MANSETQSQNIGVRFKKRYEKMAQ